MQTDCTPPQFEFEAVERRKVVADFGGGTITSNAGALLLGQLDRGCGLVERFAGCFTDRRKPELVEHQVKTLVGQRIFGIALGHEDLNDHDELRHDPVMHVLAGKLEAGRADCAPIAGKSTLNRLEHTPKVEAEKYHKIDHDAGAIEDLFVAVMVEGHKKPPKEIVIDLDATDDPLHGEQEGRFFHGYYGCYCYLPLYIFCGHFLLAAKLRPSSVSAAEGALEEIERIVGLIRRRWPRVRIVLRGDSAFSCEDLMSWCETQKRVDYVFGQARNSRLEAVLAPELAEAERRSARSGEAARLFKDFAYQTERSWSRARRVVGKAEHLPGGANPRFVVTSLGRRQIGAKALYEDLYCARGDMENRIKEQQLDLFADRTSSATMQANQLRLWFASMAYVLVNELRRIALPHSQFAKATVGTIRLKLLKIGALVRISVRRVHIAMSSACPYQSDFELACIYLERAFPR